MRIRLLSVALCSSALAVSAGLLLDGCGAPDESIFYCNPDATLPDPLCVPDAGPDGAADGPGIGPQACTGRCVPFPDDTAAGFWSQDPLLVWAGPPDEFPKDGCPPDMALQFSRYAELVAPPLVCPICGCEKSVGKCSGCLTRSRSAPVRATIPQHPPCRSTGRPHGMAPAQTRGRSLRGPSARRGVLHFARNASQLRPFPRPRTRNAR